MTKTLRIMLGGDVMLGRMVKEAVLERGTTYPLQKISPLLKQADLTIVNLECAITNHPERWHGAPKAFYFEAPCTAAKLLADAKVGLVNLANNHTLDFGMEGLFDTLHHLEKHKIQHVGAGKNFAAAQAPVVVERQGLRIGMAAFCDQQADFAAGENFPGIAYLNLQNAEHALAHIDESLAAMRKAKVDWPILSLHWGPSDVFRPSQHYIDIAHTAIELGYKIIYGHSAHIFHGVELYQGCPIIYSAGDLLDDYPINPELKNDQQLLFELELTESSVKRILLHPVVIANCQVQPAQGAQLDFIATRAIQLGKELGTTVERHPDHSYLTIAVSE